MKKLFTLCAGLFLVAGMNAAVVTPTLKTDEGEKTAVNGGEYTLHTVATYDDLFDEYSGNMNPELTFTADDDCTMYLTITPLEGSGLQYCGSGACKMVTKPMDDTVELAGETPWDSQIDAMMVTIPAGQESFLISFKITYTVDDDETPVEFTVNLYLDKESGVDSIGMDAMPVATRYFNLAGQEVSNPENGIFVSRTTLSDGRIVTRKVVK